MCSIKWLKKIQSLVESNKSLVNAVSHELRTPVSRIEFNIELARQSSGIEERNRHLDHIESSIDELKALINEMLLYARFDRDKPNFNMESVNIYDWLNAESKNWQNGESNIKIQIEVADKTRIVSIERYYMSRAVGNLIRNALVFAKTTILVSAQTRGTSFTLSVADDGPGIDYTDRSQVFEPFIRLDSSRNRDSGGTGLGLAIVKQILAWHSGQVWVEESESGGAKFIAQWPTNHQGDS
ncbi:MAG: ATP-binding protein [Candidatus Thiodiazotropha sp. L084R]